MVFIAFGYAGAAVSFVFFWHFMAFGDAGAAAFFAPFMAFIAFMLIGIAKKQRDVCEPVGCDNKNNDKLDDV